MQSHFAYLTVGVFLIFIGWIGWKMPQEDNGPVEAMLVRQRLFELIRTKWESQEETSNLNVEQRAELVLPSEPVPPQSAALPLGTHFCFPLFPYVGADVAALLLGFSVESLIHSLFGLMSFCVILKLKREKTKLEKKVFSEKNIHRNDAVIKKKEAPNLEELQRELTQQRVQDVLQREEESLKTQLRAVGQNIQSNREQLQEVEEQISERETELNKPAELLRQKKELLRAQWGLGAEKNHLEKQHLLLEKLQEAAELQ